MKFYTILFWLVIALLMTGYSSQLADTYARTSYGSPFEPNVKLMIQISPLILLIPFLVFIDFIGKMKWKEFHENMIYDEYGRKDYQGYVLAILMIGYALFMILSGIGVTIYLIGSC